MEQIILHVDMDAFYASVEIRDDENLMNKPLIIGSMPNERGVVATCSYEARKYGVRSGMNIKDAYRLCPNGVYMHPNFDKYKQVSSNLHDIWNTYATASEYIALDEAYLDITEKAKDWDGARKIANLIKQRTLDEIGLTCSIGIAYSKVAAKTASEEKKPNGYFEILKPSDFVDLMSNRSVQNLYTVGPKTTEKLNANGIKTIGEISKNEDIVKYLFGKQGEWIVQIAKGRDDRKVVPYKPEDAKTISREYTFQEDVNDYEFLRDVLLLLSMSVDKRAKKVGLHGRGVSLKITYSNMKSISKSKSVISTEFVMDIYYEALKLLEQVDKRDLRLIGVGIYHLTTDEDRQLTFTDVLDDYKKQYDKELENELMVLARKYDIDCFNHIEQLYEADRMYDVIENMRKCMVKKRKMQIEAIAIK